MYEKFSKSNVSKLGREIIRAGGLSPLMEMGVLTAIPTWEMLGLSEGEYNEKYRVKEPEVELTEEPTGEPTGEPTEEPTDPEVEPTGEPTEEPQGEPEVS
jgi:hypothetical protein